ncbi:MAG: tetratricopeptide repeat protein [Sulfuricellaceae bacterium]
MNILFNSAKTGGTGNQVTQIIQVGAGSQQQELKLSLGFIKLDAGHDHGLPRLLKWNGRISPLLGRDAELVQLRAWLADPQGDPVQIVSGPGGVGKTRLAAEFAQELRDLAPPATKSRWDFFKPKTPQPTHWKAGFVALDDLGESLALHGDEAALCILDYPEERTASLRRWIDALAALPSGQRKLRVLFVTRSAETVKQAFGACHQQHLLPKAEIKLTAIAAEEGYQVLNATLARLAELGYPAIVIKQTDFAAWRSLSPLHESPLFVVALAIHLAGGSDTPSTLQLAGVDLLDALCGNEENRLRNIGQAHGVTAQNAIADVLAWATLLDKLEPAERAALCDELLPGQSAAVLAALRASGATGPVLAHLEPDLLAAWWLHRWKTQRLDEMGAWDAHTTALAEQMAQREPGAWSACTLHWNRLGYDLASRLGQPNAIDRWATQHITTTWQPHAAAVRKAFEQQINWYGLPHAAIAASRVETLAAAEGDETESALAKRGRLLHSHAIHLANAGERNAALATVREVVEIYRSLAQTHPAAFEPGLARSLNNLAKFLSDVGERDAALASARETVEILRRLAQTNPVAFEPVLATSLNNLAKFLSDVGERDAALATARETVEILRHLAQTNSVAFEPDLARSLSNLAKFLSDAGDRDAALPIAREAVEIYRRLAQTHPAAFEPDLARSLNNLANFLSEAGGRDAALTTAREAVEIYSRLAQTSPAAFEPVLAMSLNNLADHLSDAGEYKAALATAREAVEIYRRLAQTNPAAFEPDLARSLAVLARACLLGDDRVAARDAAHEALTLIEPWAQRMPAAYAGLRDVIRGLLGMIDGAAG